MNRERRRYRRLMRGVSTGVLHAVSASNVKCRKESMASLLQMGCSGAGLAAVAAVTAGGWRRGWRRSPSTASDASGLSELESRLEDFSVDSPSRRTSPSPLQPRSNYFGPQWPSPCTLRGGFLGPHWDPRAPRAASPHPRGCPPAYDRSKYVWRKSSPATKADLRDPSEPVEDSAPNLCAPVSLFKDECADEVFEKACDNHVEILSLGWQWLKITVSVYKCIFLSSATVKDIEAYTKECHEIEERMVICIGSSNFQSDYVPLSVANLKKKPTEEIVLFVVLIHYAFVEHNEVSYKFLVGGIIGTMVYLFITFKAQYPNGHQGAHPRKESGNVCQDVSVVNWSRWATMAAEKSTTVTARAVVAAAGPVRGAV